MRKHNRLIALLLALVLLLAFALTACGGSDGGDKTPDTSNDGGTDTTGTGSGDNEPDKTETGMAMSGGSTEQAAASTEKTVEEAIGVGSTSSSFLGHFDATQVFSTEVSDAASYLCYDQLFNISSEGTWYSNVLSDYYWSDEVENQLVLVLKDNITFASGDKMTMEDVLWSLQQYSTSPRGGTNFTVVDWDSTYISDDGLTLYIQYTQSYGPWNSGLNRDIMNKSFVEALPDDTDWYSPDSCDGSGPYKPTDNTIGVSMSFEKRDDWWQQDEIEGKAQARTITCYSYSDNTTMMADFVNGVIDLAINLNVTDCEDIAADPSLGTYQLLNSASVAQIVLSPQNVDLQNEKIREAICIGCDTAAMTEVAYGILGKQATSTFNQVMPYYVGGHAYTYDPERAKQLVAESGIENPTFKFVVVNANQSLAESFQYYMEQIGITIDLEVYDQPTAVSIWQSGGTDLYLNGAAMPNASYEPADATTFYRASFSYSCTAQTDPEIVDLLEEGRAATDTEKRAEIYGKVQDYFYDHYSIVPIAEWYGAYAYNSRISEADIVITMAPNLRNITFAE